MIARDSTDFFAVDSVAHATGVSRRTLERRFRASCDRSIAKEIRRLRILKAKRLLAETEMQIKQVALETGFRDPVRLHEVFVREEEMTPSQYRAAVRGE